MTLGMDFLLVYDDRGRIVAASSSPGSFILDSLVDRLSVFCGGAQISTLGIKQLSNGGFSCLTAYGAEVVIEYNF